MKESALSQASLQQASSRQSSAEAVVRRLRDEFSSGRYQGGERVSQEQLALKLGVSRTPVRDALQRLCQEGLIEMTPTGRITIAACSPEEMREQLETRMRLETWLLELALPVITKADLDKAEAILERMEDCSDEDWGDLKLRFHKLLYASADRPTILSQVETICHWMELRRRRFGMGVGSRKTCLQELRQILDYARKGDCDGAVLSLQNHILAGGQMIVERLRACAGRKADNPK